MKLSGDMQEALDAVDSEIRFQHALRDNDTYEMVNTVQSYLLLLGKYADQARTKWCDNRGEEPALHEVRKIAALALRCLDEHGAPSRGPDPRVSQ